MPKESISQSKFNLENITEFNPALIYSFDLEASRMDYSPDDIDYVLHGAGQYQDMFDAYFYAQETILPTIRNEIKIANITSQQLLEQLNQIHRRIANTLAEDNRVSAGEFTRRQVLRWRWGSAFQDIVIMSLADSLPPNIDLLKFAKARGINADESDANRFLQLLRKIHDDKSISIPEDQKPYVDEASPGELALHKLVVQYHSNRLTPEEKVIVEKVVKVCMQPKEYQQAMQKFADDLVERWHRCDPNNIDQVAKLARTAFYGLTEIHPYFNGNGRTATCLMNVILRSLGKPAILLRNPGERENTASSYNQAIEEINTQPDLLIRHIKNRIQETEAHGGYKDDQLAEFVTLQVKLSEVIRTTKKQFPDYDLQKYFKALYQDIETEIESKNMSRDNKTSVYAADLLFTRLTALFEKLSKQIQKLITPAAVQRAYTASEKEAIVAHLEALTGYAGWKVYRKNGLSILLNVDNEAVANQLAQALQETKALKAEATKIKNTDQYVVHLSSINPDKLKVIQFVDGLKKSAKEKSKSSDLSSTHVNFSFCKGVND